ncbi:MAG: 30S ribosomal protein S20 [Actinobacteria bacterium]|nr:30S ribosomal protein S20 [Actinomycetota bacterium]
MANIKSQIKRNRQSAAANERNKSVRSRLRTITKNFLSSVESGDAEQSAASFREVSRELDKAAAKRIIHKNKAANQKSRLAKRLKG